MKFHQRLFCKFATLAGLALTLAASEFWAQQQKQKEDEDEKVSADSKALEAKACGPDGISYSTDTDKTKHPTPEPPAGKAMIFVVRPTMAGNKVQSRLGVDGKWIGVNRGDNYFFFALDPGQHYFCSQAENRSVMAMKVEAGKTYYLQQKIRMGFMKARNKLEALEEKEGKEGLAKSHPSSWTEKK